MKSSFSRNLVTYALILLITLLLMAFCFQFFLEQHLEERAEEKLKNNCETISRIVSAYYDEAGKLGDAFLTNLAVVGQVTDADMVVCNAEGTVLLCSDAPLGCVHQGMTVTGEKFLEQVKTGEHVVRIGIMEGLYPESRITVAYGIWDTKGTLIGIVLSSTPVVQTTAVAGGFSSTFLVISVSVMLLAILAVSIYARKNANPLRDMAKAANAFGHGDFTARAKVPEGGAEELRELAMAFNNMAISLEKGDMQRREFIANVSHELKTPMTTIGGYLDGMLDGTIPEEKHRYYMEIVSEETKRLSRLVRSMLDISRLQEQEQIPEEQKTQFDLTACAGEVLLRFEKKILDKQLQVQVDMPEFSIFTLANRDYITQVIYNLLDNAVKFCPEQGQIGLRLQPAGSKIYFSVSNEGPAVPPEELPLLFERFHKVDRSCSQN